MYKKQTFYQKYIKRLLDIIFATIFIIVLSPLFILISVLILIEDFGPVLFRQKRLGVNKKIFVIYKFRSMYVGAEKKQVFGKEVIGKDDRILKIGYLIRRTKIDELPQLINVLKGDMSFVGPRPLTLSYLNEFEKWEDEKFEVKPGLSGLAQVNGNIYLTRQEKSKYDIDYVRNINFLLDVRIVLKTFLVIILGEGKFKK